MHYQEANLFECITRNRKHVVSEVGVGIRKLSRSSTHNACILGAGPNAT